MPTIINLDFKTDQETKKAIKKLRADIDTGKFQLFPGAPLTYRDDYDWNTEIYLESDNVQKTGNTARFEILDSFPGSFSACAESFKSLGSISFNILECIDDEEANSSYFVEGIEVGYLDYYKHKFGSHTLSKEFLERVFLDGQRRRVEAVLVKANRERTETGYMFMEFSTPEGQQFVYRGHDNIERMADGSYDQRVSFLANFELAIRDKKLQSFALYPSQIKFEKRKLDSVPKLKGGNRELYESVNGRFFEQYIVDFGADIERSLLSITQDSICNVPFSELFEYTFTARESGRFTAFGLNAYIWNYEDTWFFKIAGGGSWLDNEIDVSKLAEHLESQSIHVNSFEDGQLRTNWNYNPGKVELFVGPDGFRIMITDEWADFSKLSFY
jgi:hypothetical protein